MLNNATWSMLNETEKALLREVEPKRLAKLDEDGLSDLHDRIRRARKKYNKLYQRRAAAQVSEDASRKKAQAQHSRSIAKAEAFEDALAIVSRELAKAARASAKTLKEERLAMARGSKGQGSDKKSGKPKGEGKVGSSQLKGKSKSPISKRSVASQRSTKARSVAIRDSK
jgi:hypothetical protein